MSTAAVAAFAAVAEEEGVAARTADAGRAGRPVAAVAEQDAAVRASLACRNGIAAVADQKPGKAGSSAVAAVADEVGTAADTGGPAVTPVAEQYPAVRASICSQQSVAAVADQQAGVASVIPGSAVADQPGISAATVDPAVATVAVQQPAVRASLPSPTAVAAVADQKPRGAGGTAGGRRADSAATAVAEKDRAAAVTTGGVGTRTAVAAVAEQEATVAAVTPGGDSQVTGSAVAAIAEQPGGAAGPTGLADPAGPTVAAIAEQDPAGPAGLPRGPVGAIADQRAPEHLLCGRVQRANRLRQWRHVCGLGAGILRRGARDELHKLLMERRRLRAERLKGLRVRAEQPCDCRRHLIGARRQHPDRRRCCRRGGCANGRTEVR